MKKLLLSLLLIGLWVTPAFAGASTDFDGTGDKVTVANHSSLNLPGGDATVAVWIKPDAFGSYTTVYEKGTSAAGREYSLFINSTTEGFLDWGGVGGPATVTFSPAMTTGEWQFVMVTNSGTTQKTYRNCVENSSRTVATTATGTDALEIGLDAAAGGSDYDGKQAWFHIYKGTALTTDQCKQIMNAPETITPTATMLLQLDGRSPNPDLTGNGNSGTLTNATASSDGPPVFFPKGRFYSRVPSAVTLSVLQGAVLQGATIN